MNPHELKRRFPNASPGVLAANSGDYGSGKPSIHREAALKAPVAKPQDMPIAARVCGLAGVLMPEQGHDRTQPQNSELRHDHHPDPQLPDSKQRQRPKTLEGGREGKAPGAGLPVVRFILCRRALLDVDAKWASVKDLLDGLRYAGLICGDKEGEITLEVTQRKTAKGEEERTEIQISLKNEDQN